MHDDFSGSSTSLDQLTRNGDLGFNLGLRASVGHFYLLAAYQHGTTPFSNLAIDRQEENLLVQFNKSLSIIRLGLGVKLVK
ncbi:MAG: hypothetical protein AAFU67_03100 [Bacteroidota bacterium]